MQFMKAYQSIHTFKNIQINEKKKIKIKKNTGIPKTTNLGKAKTTSVLFIIEIPKYPGI